MTAPRMLRGFCLVILALAATACQRTSFELPPIAASGCDPALVGRWQSLDSDDRATDDIVLDFDAACMLRVGPAVPDPKKPPTPTQAHAGRHGDARYLWVDAAWLSALYESSEPVPPGDVVVMRYRATAEGLELQGSDDKAIARAIAAGEIPGQSSGEGPNLRNRITGGPHPRVLDRPDAFSAALMRFRRLPVSAE
jgi:hypothetical protein